MKFTVTEKDLKKMVADKVLPEKSLIGWHAINRELFPTANTGKVVVFEPFFYRGLLCQPVNFSEVFFIFMGLS